MQMTTWCEFYCLKGSLLFTGCYV